MAQPPGNRDINTGGDYHEDRRDMRGSSGDVNENIGRDSVRGNVHNEERNVDVERDYRETNVSGQGQYAEGDINPDKSNKVTTSNVTGGIVAGGDASGVADQGSAGRDISGTVINRETRVGDTTNVTLRDRAVYAEGDIHIHNASLPRFMSRSETPINPTVKILHIELKARGDKFAEFRFFWDNPNEYGPPRNLSLVDIAELNERANTDYYTSIPVDYAQTGRKLFNWLDGTEGLFNRSLERCPHGEQVVLAISASGRLANLPWELLHDGTRFLIERRIVPVRWVKDKSECLQIRNEPKNRFLNVLFMATSPRGVKPELDFEAEEGRIIKATQKKRSLCLTVEESGNLQELHDLVGDYDRDYFDMVHLTGHADIDEGKPYFLTETEYGDRKDSSAAEIARSLNNFPPLIFLSGCRTGYFSDNAVPLMAEALLKEGATAVLSWGDGVSDENASMAAAILYEALSTGRTITEALAETYRKLLEYQGPDTPPKGISGVKCSNQWHLLRCYIADALPGALVTAPRARGRKRAPAPTVTDRFIDEQRRLRLIPRTEFVGRRRQLQNCLRVLKTDWEKVGVLLQGMGGLGKSAIAARLCDRLSDYKTLVWWRQVDESGFAKALAEKLAREHREILKDSSQELKYRLRDVFAELNEQAEKPFLLVFDDFEWNLEPRDGGHILQTKVAEILESLIWAIQETDAPDRLIITCRYQFQSELLDKFFMQRLDGFHRADLQKKLSRLVNFDAGTTDDGLIERAIALADGNPRLLEWLNNEVLSREDAQTQLTQLENSSSDWKGKIIWEELYQQIDKPLGKILSRCLVYEIPVPIAALEVVCKGLLQYKEQLQRAINLGLIEVSSEVEQRNRTYRVSRILPHIIPSIQFPPEPKVYSLYQKAWKKLSKLWGKIENENEEQWQEIFRLKLADITNGQRFREGFGQMLSFQGQAFHKESDRAFEAELRKEKKQLKRSTLCEHLEALLHEHEWIQADIETAWIFYQIMVQEGFDDFEVLCRKFPVKELNEIDDLWVKYSLGRFGFSVQKKIYQSVGGTDKYDRETWDKFGKQVEWYDGEWRNIVELYRVLEAEYWSEAPVPLVPALWITRDNFWEGGWSGYGLGWFLLGGFAFSSLASRLNP